MNYVHDCSPVSALVIGAPGSEWILLPKRVDSQFPQSPVVVEITSGLLTRNVQIPQQALFARQELYTGQEPLQALEVDVAFRCDQSLFPFLPCMMPALRDPGGAVGCVGYADLAKPCSRNESFILSRRAVHVKAD